MDLFRACKDNDIEVVELLLDRGANIHVGGVNALRWAAESGHIEIVKLLSSYYTYEEIQEIIKKMIKLKTFFAK